MDIDTDEMMKIFQILGVSIPKKKSFSSKNKGKKGYNTHTTTKSHSFLNSRIVQNFIVVWLDPNIDEDDTEDLKDSLTEFGRVVHTTRVFTDVDGCVDFMTELEEEKILMIISEEIAENIVPFIHDIIQINSIYIFCKKQSHSKQWIGIWSKIKGFSDCISSLSEKLKQDAQNCDQDSISISFVPPSNKKSVENIDHLDPTFMYTQILKEILLKIDFNEKHITYFVKYYRKTFIDNAVQLQNIDQFEKQYRNHTPIWWYTHECFLYSLLNRALRMMEVDTLIEMGFFIHDIHGQIAELHDKQFVRNLSTEKFITYRGQGLFRVDFEKLEQTQGGLISFNNFLSTSKDPAVAYGFARSSLANPASIGIVFVIKVDPSIKSAPFAAVKEVSQHEMEDEILFSMHTIFRIGNMIKSGKTERLWQVDLIQTSDNDLQLNDLTESIRKDLAGSNEWERLGKLLNKLGQFTKSEELYEVLLDQTDDDHQRIHCYQQLGWSTKSQKRYEEAVDFYEKALAIKEKNSAPNHPSFAVFFTDIGGVYEKMEHYSKALLFYERGLTLQLSASSSNHVGLGYSYSNIGSVYDKMKDYTKAIEYHQKAIEVRKKLPAKDKIKLAYSYNHLGSVYEKMDNYTKALESHEKALEIEKKLLPSNHPDLAQSYSKIGSVYSKLERYPEACKFHQQAVDIGKRSLLPNHPRLQYWQRNLAYVKRKCGE